MRQQSKLVVLVLSLLLLVGLPWVSPKATVLANYPPTFIQFYDALSPYGYWFNTSYGPVWRPANQPYGWQPYYSNGSWQYTQYGWTWVSSDPWAPVAYHYGSWYNDQNYGWLWVPGYTWAPSWVTWQYNDNYVGWAPLPPNAYLNNWNNGYQDYGYDNYGGYNNYNGYYYSGQPVVVDNSCYVFVPAQNLTTNNLTRVRVPVERNVEIIRRARPATTINVVNNTVVNHGPRVAVLNSLTRNPVALDHRIQPQRVQLQRDNRPQINVASPEINRREATRVVRDFDRGEREARADRTRQIQQRDRTDISPRRNNDDFDNDARRVEREQRRIDRQQQERQQPERQIERQQRNREQFEQRDREQRQVEREQRRQQEEVERRQRSENERRTNEQLEREQRRQERERQRQVEEQQRQTEQRRQVEQQQEQQRQQEREQRRLERQQQRQSEENRQPRETNNEQEREQRRQERQQRRAEQDNQWQQNNNGNQPAQQQRRARGNSY